MPIYLSLCSPWSGPHAIWDFGGIPVSRVCSATSLIVFRSSECVPPRHWSISGRYSVFRHIPGRFPVSRGCSDASGVDFRSAEYVPPCPGTISSQQSMFRHIPGQFPVNRVCSAMSQVNFSVGSCSAAYQVNFWLAECVPPRPGSISSQQRVFHHFSGSISGR